LSDRSASHLMSAPLVGRSFSRFLYLAPVRQKVKHCHDVCRQLLQQAKGALWRRRRDAAGSANRDPLLPHVAEPMPPRHTKMMAAAQVWLL